MTDLYRLTPSDPQTVTVLKRLISTDALERVEAEKMWWCERDDLGDPNCFKRHPYPKPGQAWHPTKHSACRWVLIVEVDE